MASRRLEGILQYHDDSNEFRLRDFRFLEGFTLDDTDPPPPWTNKADGAIICLGMDTDDGSIDEAYSWLQRGGVPVISLVSEWRHPKIPIVCTDSNAVIRMGCDYLSKLGHKHFAYVGDTINPKDITRRRKIFRKALAKPGQKLLYCDFIERPDGSVEDINRALSDTAMARFLQEAPKPLAVFAISDLHARSICCICQELGLDIPGDVAILGSGNLSSSRSHSPTISSVQTPHH
ncbi:MAG: substrate-binding domain-containing protein, partial [Phycisphaerales bacterium]|nr:substrate-binding domain-containing protein [Phycisphaerales bacterium]